MTRERLAPALAGIYAARVLSPKRATSARVLVRAEHPRGAYATRVLRGHARRFLSQRALVPAGAELSVLLATDPAVRALNRTFRKKDRPTDVLSFEQDSTRGLLGDVVISLDTARRQASEGGRPLSDELARLLAHGLLHLLGHDHQRADDARAMADAEIRLLGTVGLVAESLGSTPAELEFRRARPTAARRPTMTGAPPRSRENRR